MTLKGKLVGVVILVTLLGAVAVQRELVREARAERERLQVAAQESSSLEPQLREESPPADHEGRRELARLRNEVRQLRAQKPDMDRLRSANERLALKIAEMSKPPIAATEEQGFVMRQNWAAAGFGSPEALLLTFFWAAREQDYQNALACMTPEGMTSMIDKHTANLKSEAIEGLARLAAVQGLRVAGLRTNSTDSFHMDVQSNPNGPAITFSLRRIGEEWKIHRF
jgi:hypothetical protein